MTQKRLVYIFILLAVLVVLSVVGYKTQTTKISSRDTADEYIHSIGSIDSDIELSNTSLHDTYDRFHTYGDVTLELQAPGYYYYDGGDKEGFEIHESFPGILNYFYRGETPYSGFKIEIYNEVKELVRIVDLEEETPYSEKTYPGIWYGYPDMEYFSYAEAFDPLYRNSAEYFTTVNEMSTNENGVTVVRFQLIPLRDQYIIGEEETVVVYNNEGNELGRMTLSYPIGDIWVSDDTQFLALIIGGPTHSDSWYGSEAIFQIYDLTTNELIYEQHQISEQEFGGLVEADNGFLILGNSYKEGEERIMYFFDFKNRIKYFKQLSPEERDIAFKDFTTYSKILEDIVFEKENF